MALFLAALLSTAVWVLSFWAMVGQWKLAALAWVFLYAVLFWSPLLLIFTVSAAIGRRISHNVFNRVLWFYGCSVVPMGVVLGGLYVIAPNPGNRDAAFGMIFQTMLIPSALSSLIYPIFALSRRAQSDRPTTVDPEHTKMES